MNTESKTFSAVLVADGTSDRALVPLIQRAIEHLNPHLNFGEIAFPHSEVSGLQERVRDALARFPCELLFVHRDAESQDPTLRHKEIVDAVDRLNADHGVEVVAVVPVRMTEAWLICDPSPIRSAAGNPNGTADLGLPPIAKAESVDAKQVLDAALIAAVALGKRRRGKFRPDQCRHLVAENLPERELLLRLPSYAKFEKSLAVALARLI